MIAVEHYNAILEQRHWWFATRRAYVERELAHLSLSGCPFILDIGCGTGGNLPMLSRFGSVMGVDSSVSALSMCPSQDKVMHASAEAIPFPDGWFDVVTMMDVLEHIEDEGAALAEARRVLSPTGRIIITVPAYQRLYSYHDKALGHLRRYSARGLCGILKARGFHVERIYGMFGLLLPVAWAQRKLKPRHTAGDFDAMGPILNTMLTTATRMELGLARLAPLPWGTSLLAVARKEQ